MFGEAEATVQEFGDLVFHVRFRSKKCNYNVVLMIDRVGNATLYAGDNYIGVRVKLSDRWGQSKIALIGVDGRIGGDFTLTP